MFVKLCRCFWLVWRSSQNVHLSTSCQWSVQFRAATTDYSAQKSLDANLGEKNSKNCQPNRSVQFHSPTFIRFSCVNNNRLTPINSLKLKVFPMASRRDLISLNSLLKRAFSVPYTKQQVCSAIQFLNAFQLAFLQ